MKGRKIFASVSSNVGTRKKKNEDNFYLNGVTLPDNNPKHVMQSVELDDGVFAVADGMGGMRRGEFASKCAVAILDEFVKGKPLDSLAAMDEYVELVNNKICDKINETKEKIGTTITVVSIKDKAVKIYNVGDSRCYLYRDGTLTLLSKDHTLVSQLVEMNVITAEEAKTDKRRNQLYQHVGMMKDDVIISPFEGPGFDLAKDDMILLFSDGVTDVIDDDEIVSIIEETTNINKLTNRFLYRALKKGTKDNVTAMIIKYAPSSKSAEILSWVLGIVISAILGIIAGLIII